MRFRPERLRYLMDMFEFLARFAPFSPGRSRARHHAFSDDLCPVCTMILLFRSAALPFGTFASLFEIGTPVRDVCAISRNRPSCPQRRV